MKVHDLLQTTLESDSSVMGRDTRHDLNVTHGSMRSALADGHGSGRVRDSGSSIGPASADTAASAAANAAKLVGQPISFEHGPFAGHTVRSALEEIQGPRLGFICPTFDPDDEDSLDPPPVVLLHLHETLNHAEREIRYDPEWPDMNGMVCSVDLLRVPDNCYTYGNYNTASSGSSHVGSQSTAVPDLHPGSTDAVVHRVKGFPIYESSRCTKELAGNHRFVEASFVRHRGRKLIVFAFNCLAVRMEGTFVLHYRFFRIGLGPYPQPAAVVQAELYGSPFRVVSKKSFPGYRPSTELTKSLWAQGIWMTVRPLVQEDKDKAKKPLFSTTPLERRR